MGEDAKGLLTRQLTGRLAAVLFFGSGLFSVASLPLPQPAGASRSIEMEMAILAVALGTAAWFAPWHRWPRSATLWLVPLALGILATANVFGGVPSLTYGMFFVIVFVWIGAGHRPWVATAFSPLAALAYVLPLLVLPGDRAVNITSVALVIPVCVLVGESLAWIGDRFARSQDALQDSLGRLRRTDLERRRLLARLVASQEDERFQLAAEIHDDTAQVLTAAAMRLDLLERKLLESDQRRALDHAGESVRRAIDRLRSLMFDLHPVVLEREGLTSALRSYLEREEVGGTVEAHIEDLLSREPPREIRVIAYRIAQEALRNVRKHAQARRVEVTLESQLGGVSVRVRDDGIGFKVDPAPNSPAGHMGLTAMRERAEMAGGRLRVQSSSGLGTTVEVWLPVEPRPGGLAMGAEEAAS